MKTIFTLLLPLAALVFFHPGYLFQPKISDRPSPGFVTSGHIKNDYGASFPHVTGMLTGIENNTPITFIALINQGVCQGDQICFPITTTGFEDIEAFQFSLNYDPDVLHFNQTMNFNLPGMTAANFGTPQEGYITAAWFDDNVQGITVPDGSTLFEICLEIVGSPGASSAIIISSMPTSIEVVNNQMEIVDFSTVDGQISVSGPSCPADIEVSAQPGMCGANVMWTVPDSLDNCGNSWTLSSSYQPGDYFPPGTTEVSYTGSGSNGLSFICSFTIIVTGENSFFINDCPDNITIATTPGMCNAIMPELTDSISVDSCFYLKKWKDIGGGYRFSAGIQEDGSLWTWGDNEFGQLGDGTFSDHNSPQQMGNDDWKEVSCGLNFTVALKTDGTLWSWGVNNFGQLGLGNFNDSNTPQQIGTSDQWKDIKTGQNHCLGLQNDGTLWAWGENMAGQLGLGDAISRTLPQQIGSDNDWNVIAAGEQASMASKTNGTLWGAGTNYANLMLAGPGITSQNTFNQVGNDSDWATFDVGGHFLGIKTGGTLWAWGNNFYQEIGNGTVINQEFPIQIGTDTQWEKVYAKSDGSFAIKTDKTLFAWGQNLAGELGLGTSGSNQGFPVQVNNAQWEMAEFGYEHSFGIQTDKSLWTTGPNTQGELGLGFQDFNILTTFTPSIPVITYTVSQLPVAGTPVSVGINSVTITLTDSNGNQSDCTFDLIVTDQDDPVLVCKSTLQVALPAIGFIDLNPEDLLDFYEDNCSALNLSVDPVFLDCQSIGIPIPVTVTATDLSGNSSFCWSEITIVDQLPPVIICPEDITVLISCEETEGFADFAPPVVTDNCTVGYSCSHNPGFFPLGNTTVTCTATDNAGNLSSCSFAVEVIPDPDQPLSIVCPGEIHIPLDDMCQGVVPDLFQFLVDISGGCSALILTQFPPEGTILNPGEVVVAQLSVIDEIGQNDFCQFLLTVAPDLPPVFVTLPDPIDDIQCQDALPEVQNLEATDDCSVPSVTYEVTFLPDFTDYCSPYTVTYTWTATDWLTADFISVSQSFQILPDTQPPVFDQLPGLIGDVHCNEPLPAQEILTATDNCSNANVTSSVDPYTVDNLNPYTIIYRWRAEDDCGNATEEIRSFQVIPDNTPPEIICPDDMVINAGPGETGMIILFAAPVVNDNCLTSWDCDHASGDFFECGLTMVNCTGYDLSGNTNECSFSIQVICNMDCEPKLACPEDIEVICPGVLDLPPPLLIDSCGMDEIRCTRGDGLEFEDPFDLGTTVINCTVTTTEGITDSCNYLVTVLTPDDVLTIICPDDQTISVPFGVQNTVVNNLSPLAIFGGVPPYSVFYTLNGATSDNGVIDASGSILNVGETILTYLVEDACGTTRSCQSTIAVDVTETGCENLTMEAVNLQEETENCCWQLNYNNQSVPDLAGIRITALNGTDLLYDPADIHPGLFDIVNSPGSVTLVSSSGPGNPIPTGQVDDFFRFCLTGMSSESQQILIEWLDTDYQVACDTLFEAHCLPEPDDCLYIIQDSVYCVGDLIHYAATFKNPLSCNFAVSKIVIDVTVPSTGAPITQVIFPVPAIQPGDTYDYIFVINDPSFGGEEICFNIVAHDALDPLNCCSPDLPHCITLPKCEPCEFVSIDYELQDSTALDSCCYTLSISNNYQTNFFESIMVEILNPGVSFSNVTYPLSTGFLNTHNAAFSKLTWTHPNGFIPIYTGKLMDFCLNNITTTAPVLVSVHWMQGDSVVCADTIRIVCHDCFILDPETEVNCDANKDYVFTLNFQNISGNPINKIKIVEDPSHNFISDDIIDLGGIFNPGDHVGPVNIPINGDAGPGEYCFKISLKLEIEDSLSMDCCYLEHCEWLPDCDSLCCFYPLDYQIALDSGFDYEVNCQEHSVTAVPNGTNFCDQVEWTFRKLGQNQSIGGITFGTSPVTFNLPEIGVYRLCMNIIRQGPEGEECFPDEGFQVCRLIFVSCPELCINENLIDPDYSCPNLNFKVCGCDGITYQNACVAEHYYGVTTWTPGVCNVISFAIPEIPGEPLLLTNPVEEILKISWEGTRLSTIHIYNLHGQLMETPPPDPDNDGFAQTDVSHLPPGLYLLQVRNENGNIRTEKFVKM